MAVHFVCVHMVVYACTQGIWVELALSLSFGFLNISEKFYDSAHNSVGVAHACPNYYLNSIWITI